MLDRMLRVIRLDKKVFKEVEENESLTQEAFLVVLISSLLSGLGTALGGGGFWKGLIWGTLSSIVFGWLLWAFLTHWIGTNMFPGKATLNEMLRVIGYATAPRVFGVLSFIPFFGGIISLIALVLSLIAGFFAIQEGLDLDTPQTLAVAIIGWLVSLVVEFVIGALLLGPALILGGLFGG